MSTQEKIKAHEDLKHKVGYNERYDAYFCKTCDEWLEKPCSAEPNDPHGCWHECSTRPAKPSEVDPE